MAPSCNIGGRFCLYSPVTEVLPVKDGTASYIHNTARKQILYFGARVGDGPREAQLM
jgi:hypothetical protein